jgi:acetoin utilization deacetylase AcuC-like enzyme
MDELVAFARAGGADALVVALGVDAAASDPNSPLHVSATGFERAGHMLGQLAVPTVVVQEGGYEIDTIGVLVLAALEGLEAGVGHARRVLA